MTNKEIRNSVLCALRLGTIQPFQVEDVLRMKGVPSFEIEKMKEEILEICRREHPCY